MKARWWWLVILPIGGLLTGVLFIDAYDYGIEEPYECDPEVEYCDDPVEQEPECYYDEETGEEWCEPQAVGDSLPPEEGGDGFAHYINRIPIPDHPIVPWTTFFAVVGSVIVKGIVVPLVQADDNEKALLAGRKP